MGRPSCGTRSPAPGAPPGRGPAIAPNCVFPVGLHCVVRWARALVRAVPATRIGRISRMNGRRSSYRPWVASAETAKCHLVASVARFLARRDGASLPSCKFNYCAVTDDGRETVAAGLWGGQREAKPLEENLRTGWMLMPLCNSWSRGLLALRQEIAVSFLPDNFFTKRIDPRKLWQLVAPWWLSP